MPFLGLFSRKEYWVKKYIENEGMYYYDRLEAVKDWRVRMFYTVVLGCAIRYAYYFFNDIRNRNNVFFRNARRLDETLGRQLLRLIAMYHTVHGLHNPKYSFDDLENTLMTVFSLNRYEQEIYASLLATFQSSEAEFEVAFSKYAVAMLFGHTTLKPQALAFVGHFFYNSLCM